MPNPAEVVHVQTHHLRVIEDGWPYAIEQAAQIAEHWKRRRDENPGFFNGPIHLLREWKIDAGQFTGDLIRTDFASFLCWREHGHPDRSVRDCFGSALLRSHDGKIILGRQAPGHINSGLTYFPGGFIDHRDVAPNSVVDVSASVSREITEELGFAPGTFVIRPGAYLTFEGQLLSIAIDHVSSLSADELVRMARSFIASERDSELEDVVAVATPADFEALQMPPFTRLLLQTLLG